MTAITILAQDETSAPDERRFRAAAGDPVRAARVVIARFGPGAYFTQAQHERQRTLLARRHALSPAERTELEGLVDAELDATVARLEGQDGPPGSLLQRP